MIYLLSSICHLKTNLKQIDCSTAAVDWTVKYSNETSLTGQPWSVDPLNHPLTL